METLNLNTLSADDFVKQVNKHRLSNKNRWYQVCATVDGKQVKIKAFGTWLQIFLVGDFSYSNSMDETPTQFKRSLIAPFNRG